MVRKDEGLELIRFFVKVAQTQFSTIVKILKLNNVSELSTSHATLDFFTTNGILHLTSYVTIAQQNVVVERKHKQVLKVFRALLFQSNLPLRFWGECALITIYLINKLVGKN